MPTCGFFDSVLKCLEVFEHFVLLPYGVDPGMLGEVVNERDIISTTTECFRLSRLNVLHLGSLCSGSSLLGTVVDVVSRIGRLRIHLPSPFQ